MKRIESLINIRKNNPELYNKLIEYDCSIFVDHKCVYEGKYDKNVGMNIESVDRALIIFDLLENYVMLTISNNESLNKVIEILNEKGLESLKDPKTYNKLVNLSFDIPEFPTIYEGSNIERIYRILEEDDSIPGDGLPDENEKEEKKKLKRRGEIQFTIWGRNDDKLEWVDNNEGFQKIDYIYSDKNKGLNIQFLLGFQDDSWKLWVGKLGSTSYDEKPFVDLKEKEFDKAILKALDEVEKMIKDIEENPDNWPQFYINI